MSVARVLSFDIDLQRRNGSRLQGRGEIPLNGITVISGKSGAGKTSLLRVLAGLEPNANTKLSFDGDDWSSRPTQDRRIGYVFQDDRLFRHLDVAGNLAFGAKRRNVPKAQVDQVIEALDLSDLLNRRVQRLSGGEARRVALARALASDPQVLFLDEPMVGLDMDRRAEVLPYITRAADQFGLAVLYVSHSLFEKNLLGDWELPVADGQIGALQDGPARLTLPVVAAGTDTVTFEVGGRQFSLPGQGHVGQIWDIRPGQGSVLTETDPGRNSAFACLPVEISACDGETATLAVGGQSLAIPGRCNWTAGQKAWLLCPTMRGRFRG